MPILARVVELTDGPIIELGMGMYSTPLLDLMCAEKKRELISFDNDPEWFDENKKWASDYHMVYFVEDWDADKNLKSILEDYPDDLHPLIAVALVDHKPAKRRNHEIKRLAKRCKFVLIHDSEPESNRYFKYTWIYKYFKYRFDYTKTRPHTTVLSNFVDVKKLLDSK
jgi:hypothetical protein